MEPAEPVAEVAPVQLDAPQGIYGLSAHPLDKGEVWLQDVEVLGLGAQVGLGRGVDVAVAAFGVPWQVEIGTVEVGVSRPIGGNVSLRGTAGVGAIVNLPNRFSPADVHPLGAAGGGFTWGSRRRHLSVSMRVGLGTETLLVLGEANVLYAVAPRGALLFGVSDLVSVYLPEPGPPWQVWLAGGAYRFEVGRFSLDAGLQLVFGPSVAWGVVPLPTLSVRYGFPSGAATK